MRQSAAEKWEAISEPDRGYWAMGMTVAGIDEAGRGPLAGPVAAGCVVFAPGTRILGVNDSKKLSPARRDALYAEIVAQARFARVGYADVEEIERLNILGATKLAMLRAAEGAPCDLFLIDALDGLTLDKPQRAIVHGDALCYHIAAASIVAKVSRDRLMLELDARYPQYGFAQHKGYGTAQHIAAIRQYGPCPAHRPSFIGHFL